MSEFARLKMADDETIDQYAHRVVAALMEDHRAGRAVAAEAEAAAEAAAAQRFEELVHDRAIQHGARSHSAAKMIARYARDLDLFEIRDGAIVTKAGVMQPGNPLRPLTIDGWLMNETEEEPYMFDKPGRA